MNRVGAALWYSLLVVMGTTCSFDINPNRGHFSCATTRDCGAGFECIPQANRPGGLCYPVGWCVPEVCDGIDNDCDGVIDNGFDLQTDNANCGACNHSCGSGTRCDAGVCREIDCSDGIDNDNNGLTDCADPSCVGLLCSTTDAGFVCGTAWVTPDAGRVDGGGDAGATDAGTSDAGQADGGALDGGADVPVPACLAP